MKYSALAPVVLTLALAALDAHAETPAAKAEPAPESTPAVARPATKLVLAPEAEPALPLGWVAAISVALAAAVVLAHLKRQGLVGKSGAAKEALRVIATKQLGPKARLVLVEARGRELLLSVGDRGATLVSDWWVDDEAKEAEAEGAPAIDDPIELAELRPPTRETQAPAARVTARPAPAPAEAPASASASAVAGLMRLRTKSSARPTKPAAPAPHLEVAAELYSQWAKQLERR